MKKFGFTMVIFATFFSCAVGHAFAATLNWAETQPVGNANANWTKGAMSDNGQILLGAISNGRVYLSINGGGSWSETRPAGDVNKSWNTISVSADGQTMLAGVVGGRLYLSTNAGTSWAETQPAGNSDKDWYSTSISANGQIMEAGMINGQMYLSTNGGGSWSEIKPKGNTTGYWIGVSMSSNGQTILAADYTARVYLSTNAGANWAEVQPAGATDVYWWRAQVSADGQTMLLSSIIGGRLYVSTNGGTNWTEAQPAGNTTQSWYGVGMSSDGQTMIVGIEGGRLYLSSNSGVSWTEAQPAGNANKTWYIADSSSDGSVLFAGANSGRLYLGQYPTAVANNPPPGLTAAACSDATPATAPDLFQITAEKSSAVLNFTTVKGATGYRVMYGLTPDATQYGDMFNYSGPAWVLDRKINYLVPNMTYYFKVQAANGCNGSTWSKVMSVRIAQGAKASTNKVLGVSTSVGSDDCVHTIVSGNSLWSIAKNKWGNGAKYKDVLSFNTRLNHDSILRIGDQLRLCK